MHTQLWGLHERLEETSADCNFALMKRPIFDSIQLGKLLGKSNMQGVSAEAQIQHKWPNLETFKALQPAQLLNLRISRIDFVMSTYIESIKIKLTNNTESPVFGKQPANKQAWNHYVEFGPALELNTIQVFLHNDELLTGFKVLDAAKNIQYMVQSDLRDGNWKGINLKQDTHNFPIGIIVNEREGKIIKIGF